MIAKTLRQTLLLVPTAALLAACGDVGAPPGPPPPPPVAVMTVEPRDLPVSYEYVGQTAGYREVEVRARVTGILQKRNFKEGAPVKAGQSLFLIDPAPFQVARNRAAADLAVAEARLAQAKRDVARLKPAYDAKAVAQKDYDDAVSAEQVAAAEVQAARARLEQAQLDLEWTRVEAPISGVSSRAVVSEGTLVSGPDVLLTTVTQTDPMYVIFGIPDREQLAIREEIQAGRVRLPADGKYKVDVKLADGTTYSQTGVLDFTDVRVSSATGTSEARAELPNPRGLLRAGEFVRVVINGATRPQAVLVPQRAVLEGPQGKFVYVVDAESKAQARPVKLGPWNGDSWVIRSGLEAGERVIVDGVIKIGPGAPVQVVPAGGATAASAAVAK
ncbi:MAG: efflux RND transporter periplasmic adaptor subunit [Pseudomonadota bacterium]